MRTSAAPRIPGDRHGEGGALNNLGLALRQVRRYDEAITACQDAATIYQETGDRHREGGALNNGTSCWRFRDWLTKMAAG